jgi:ATP-dependent DNA ligase
MALIAAAAAAAWTAVTVAAAAAAPAGRQVKHSRVILDGEVVVWNKRRCVFEIFGGIRNTINAARDGVGADMVGLRGVSCS